MKRQPSGALLTPEVVLGVTGNDVVFLDSHIEPEVLRLEVGRQAEASFKIRHIEPFSRQAKHSSEQLPGVSGGFFLISSKRTRWSQF